MDSIDLGAGLAGDTFVAKNTPSTNYSNGYLRVGTTSTSADVARVYVKFITEGTDLEGATIDNADYMLWNYRSGGAGTMNTNCGDIGSGVVTRRVTSQMTINTMTWGSGQPSYTTDGQVGETYGYSDTAGCPGAGELVYSIEDIVRGWVDGTPNHGLVMMAPSESAVINWRQYRSQETGTHDREPNHEPILFIEYEPADLEFMSYTTDKDLPDNHTYEEGMAEAAAMAPPSVADTTPEQEAAYARESGLTVSADLNQITEFAPDGVDPNTGTSEPMPTPTEEAIPVVGNLSVNPSSPAPDGSITTPSITPELRALPIDEQGRSMSVDFEVEHDPAVPEQGTGQIWAGQVTGVGSEVWAALTVPAGELTLGWRVRWRARATAGTSVGDWSGWQPLSVAGPAPSPSPSPSPSPVPGLVSAYAMDEGAGSTVTDSSGSNNNGVAVATAWTAGKYGGALSFNGSSSVVNIADSASLRLTTGMTLEAWVRPNSVSGYRTVIMKDHVEGSAYGLYSSGDGPPSAWLRQQGADNHTIASGSSPIGLNTWTHLAATYDGSTAKLYVNGQLAGQTSESGSLDSVGLPMHLGSNTFWQEYFSGLIDEVRVYNRALTAPEIQADMATPISTPPPGGLSASPIAPQRPATGRIASATASNPYTPDPIHQASDCWSYQAAKREYGFVKNRFAWCKFGHGYASAGPRGRYTDQIKFRYTVIGYTFQGSREIRLRLVIDDFKVIRGTQFNSGILNPTLGFGLSVSSKCQRRSAADPDPAVGVANPLSTWRASSNNEIEFWLTAPQSQPGVSGPDWVSNCEIQPWYDAQNTNPLYTDITPGKYSLALPWVKYGIRCDTARKMSPFNGCVFSRVLPFLRFSLAQAEVRPEQWLVESWEHFNDAIYHRAECVLTS
ncbi:LamG-like jellyroll fold domain-containing protein [Acrocarpospora sp. B8E8]